MIDSITRTTATDKLTYTIEQLIEEQIDWFNQQIKTHKIKTVAEKRVIAFVALMNQKYPESGRVLCSLEAQDERSIANAQQKLLAKGLFSPSSIKGIFEYTG